jgi:hypothetical protein
LASDVSVDAVMTELRGRVRERLRADLVRAGASPALEEPALFEAVEQLLASAASNRDPHALLLPELLGDPETWRLQTAMHYQSHREGFAARVSIGVRRKLLMPFLRWLFEYSRDNFERQRRVNQVLFACVQELAVETVQLRQQLQEKPAPQRQA